MQPVKDHLQQQKDLPRETLTVGHHQSGDATGICCFHKLLPLQLFPTTYCRCCPQGQKDTSFSPLSGWLVGWLASTGRAAVVAGCV